MTNWFAQQYRRFRFWLRRDELERELADEMALHRELKEARLHRAATHRQKRAAASETRRSLPRLAVPTGVGTGWTLSAAISARLRGR